MTEAAKDLCTRCAHREECGVPFALVEMFLAYENQAVYERTGVLASGEAVTILLKHPKEIRESDFPRISTTDENPVDMFATGENPFAGFDPQWKQTRLFIDRFFHNWTFKDLAVKYDLTLTVARQMHNQAVRRLREALKNMDSYKGKNFDAFRAKVEERSGAFPEGLRLYFLNKLFQLRPAEIAKLEGKAPSTIKGMIIRVSDKLRAGKISLFEFTDEE
jgi:hypothetical protein